MKLFNTLTNKKEEFKPLKEGEVSIYVCGPTVYNYVHIGNTRPMIVFDVLRRTFEYLGNKVTFVSNFTDVDDKIIKAVKQEGITEKELTDKYIKAYEDVRRGLNLEFPTYAPRVTETMDQIISFIQKLVDITIILTLPSKILGFIFGILEGYIVMFLILIILAIPLRNVELFKESTVVTKIMYNSPILSKTLGGVPKTIEDILDVTTEIQKTDYNKNKVALDIMKIELDHNIISKEDTLDLIERGKLDKVQGIKSFVKNYSK